MNFRIASVPLLLCVATACATHPSHDAPAPTTTGASASGPTVTAPEPQKTAPKPAAADAKEKTFMGLTRGGERALAEGKRAGKGVLLVVMDPT
jgi:hypothetical protein